MEAKGNRNFNIFNSLEIEKKKRFFLKKYSRKIREFEIGKGKKRKKKQSQIYSYTTKNLAYSGVLKQWVYSSISKGL